MSKYHFRMSWCMSWEPGVERIGKTVQEQLINWIAYEYNLGNYPDNFLMPSVRGLSVALKVKRHLIERAYQFWIKREEILYTRDRVGTFMFDPAISYPGITVASLAGFQFGKQSAVFPNVREQESMNFLTLGSSYPVPCIDVLDLRSADRSGNRLSGKDKQASWSFIDALKVLGKRKLVNNERQFCNIPDGQAVSKVLKKMTGRGDLLVMTSADDSILMETARELRLNVEFSGSDEQGMSAVRLEQICERSIVKAILVRPEPNFPIPVRMTETRWNQILDLAKRYEFGIIVLDEDYEFRCQKSPRLPLSLGTGNVIYISPYSKVYPILHKTCMVAGPENFIEELRAEVKKIVIRWNQSAEKTLMACLSRSELKTQLKKSNESCRKNAFKLGLMFDNYLHDCATLIFPGCGTSAFLKFKRKLSGPLAAKFTEHPLFYEEENFSFEPNLPIDGFRISLFIEDWTSLEFSMKMIRAMLDESFENEGRKCSGRMAGSVRVQ